MRLKDKVAIITGGGTGIGEATARLFTQQGAKVIIMGRRKDLLEKTAREIGERGGEITAIPGDVRKSSDCTAVVKETLNKYGKLDILVNNAGIARWGNALESTEELWDTVLDTNLKGLFFMTQSALAEMKKKKRGVIVNISSILGLIAMPDSAAYNASKGGVVMFTKSVAIEYAREGIRCNCICPGGVDTDMLREDTGTEEGRRAMNEMHPMGRMGEPIDIANAILFLASEESSWITGTVLPVDGGYTAQ